MRESQETRFKFTVKQTIRLSIAHIGRRVGPSAAYTSAHTRGDSYSILTAPNSPQRVYLKANTVRAYRRVHSAALVPARRLLPDLSSPLAPSLALRWQREPPSVGEGAN